MKTTMRTLSGLAAIGLILVTASVANAASGGAVCGPRDHTLRQLEGKFKEQVFGRGLGPRGTAMLELFVSKSGSWTVLVSDPKGRSCILAAGEDWHQEKPIFGDPA